jgi:hypothetical protein
MTRKTLDKIEGTVFKTTLDYKKASRKALEEKGCQHQAREVQVSIAGYLQAMRDLGVITESERKCLYIYYATV